MKQEKSLSMTLLMTPDLANFSGVVHGGALLKLLDQVAYACAAKYCKSYVVTASLDMLEFLKPIKVGALATFRANVNYVGSTSMEVGINVLAEDLYDGGEIHALSCYFTMVAKAENGSNIKVPQLQLKTEVDRRLYEAGKMRREMRKEMKARNEALHVHFADDKTD